MADTIPGNSGSTQTLALDSSASSDIDHQGDSDWWRVTLQSGFNYQITVAGAGSAGGTLPDPLLRIFNAGSVQLAINDDSSATDLDAYLEFRPAASGTYFIAAESGTVQGLGSYTVSIYRDALASTASAATIPADGRYIEDIGYGDDLADWVAVSLQAGVEYVFDLVGAAFDGDAAGYTLADPWLALRNAAGLQLREDDDGGVGANARIVFTAAVSGTYFLDAEGYDVTDFGSYALVANRAPRQGALTLGVPIAGTLQHDGDTRWYSFSAQAGKSYLIDVAGGSLSDPLVELLYDDGTVYDYADDQGTNLNPQLGFTATVAGSYFVAVRSSGHSGSGSFTLNVQQLPRLSIADATLVEGQDGSAELVFSLSLSEASAAAVSLRAATDALGTASAGSDFQATSQLLTIPAGQLGTTLRVAVSGDRAAESTELLYVNLTEVAGAVLADGVAVGLIVDDDTPLPSSDPLLPYQWYLYQAHGVNALPVMGTYHGQGVRVVVFDQGIDATNPDLQPNVALALSRDADTLAAGGAPQGSDDNHGTAVAGTIAAAAGNGGLAGVASRATLVSVYSDLALDAGFVQTIASALTYARGFDVLNNSWGTGNLLLTNTNYAFYDDFGQPAWAAAAAALKALADSGRGGLGTIVVQSAGNAFDVGDDTNLHNFQNSRHIVTVGATGFDGRVASYSSTGASILVAAPGGDGNEDFGKILSTDRRGAAGYAAGDTAAVSGTSFSSPLVAGLVALMLEANPRLGWRDVQEILVRSARRTDFDGNDWDSNGGHEFNGGGAHVDSLQHDLGFGLVDARAAVRLAETWGRNPSTSANLVERSLTHQVNLAIPDNGVDSGAGPAFDSIHVEDDLRVERAEVTLHVTHPWVGDLYAVLTSPAGTSSFLIARPASGALSAFGSSQSNIHFTLSTVLAWGENARGDWSLGVFDAEAASVGRFDSWTLTLIGSNADADDRYTYTDEFATLAAEQPARATLADSSGIDTLDAAAVTTDLRIDLSRASASRIAGQTLTLAEGTQIENAIGGDGNDVLIGNPAINRLHGGRGSDTLDGGASDYDIASFEGPDAVDADLTRGTALQGSDVDQLLNIEALIGSSAADTLRGRAGAENLRSDTLRGGGGDDTLDGGSGNDSAEFLGPRTAYTITRDSAASPDLTVVDNAGSEGTDRLLGIERLVFADRLVAFGSRAEEIARVAFVLWTPEIIGSTALFARGLSYYDVGYDFTTMCGAALTFWSEQDSAFAALLLRGTPGTTKSAADILAIMTGAGGGEAGRIAALAAMANDPATTANLAAKNVFLAGVAADLSVPGFGTLFAFVDG